MGDTCVTGHRCIAARHRSQVLRGAELGGVAPQGGELEQLTREHKAHGGGLRLLLQGAAERLCALAEETRLVRALENIPEVRREAFQVELAGSAGWPRALKTSCALVLRRQLLKEKVHHLERT